MLVKRKMVTQNADKPAVHISSGKSCCRLGLQRDVGFYHCGVCRLSLIHISIALSILAISRPMPPLAPVTKAFNFPYLLVSPSILVLPLPSGLSAAIIPILYLGYHFTRFFTIYPLLFPCDMLKDVYKRQER